MTNAVTAHQPRVLNANHSIDQELLNNRKAAVLSIDELTTATAVLAVALLVGIPILGLIVRHLLTHRLARSMSIDTARTRHVVLDGLSRVILAWSVIGGIYGAVVSLPLETGLQGGLTTFLQAAAILAGALTAARITGGVVGQYASKHDRLPGSTSIFVNIGKMLILAIGVLVALATVGVSVAPILTALGVGGLAVALALQDTLSNMFAGIHVITSKTVRPGDYVLLDNGEEGYVVDINWRNTSLRNLRNNVIVVPNARLASSILTNYYQPAAEMSLLVAVGVSYESDLDLVERITIGVARSVMREVEGGVPDFQPFIRFHTFGDFSIDMNVILRVKEHTDQFVVKHEFVKRLQRRYREVGITIPFPIRTVRSMGDSFDEDDEMAIAGAASD